MSQLIDIVINCERWFVLDNLPNEEWSNIFEFEDVYSVSNYGRIINHNTNKILRLTSSSGYWGINLYKKQDGVTIRKFKGVHRLMGLAFIPNPENKPQINHKDGNKLNLKLSNLEWNTSSENTQHAYDNGLTHLKTGADSPNAIPIDQYTKDGEYIKTWGGATCVLNELGINKSNIIQCCKGNAKSAGGYTWKYHCEKR